jgi:hypothetical protein
VEKRHSKTIKSTTGATNYVNRRSITFEHVLMELNTNAAVSLCLQRQFSARYKLCDSGRQFDGDRLTMNILLLSIKFGSGL